MKRDTSFCSPRSCISFLIVCLCLIGIKACSSNDPHKLPSAAKSILEKADKIELISLYPGQMDEPPPEGDYFGWKELGRTTIQDPETRETVATAVQNAIIEGRTGAKCFDPRHAIHADHKGKTVDILICFHCSQVLIYLNEKQGPYIAISESPQPLLD